MSAPLIGITTYAADAERRFHLPRDYVDAVRRAGGVPVLISPGETFVGGLLNRIDGLLLTGGGDIDPDQYGGCRHETICNVDADRDGMEMALIRAAVDRNLPVLGICRGSQVINVALGGTLIEHLPDVVGDKVAHRLPPRSPSEHGIRVKSDSRLASMLQQLDFVAASWHHQAIRQVAPGLEAVAVAPDGTVEAVEMPRHPWLIGVQWHPELTAAKDTIQQRLFDRFVQAAVEKRRGDQ